MSPVKTFMRSDLPRGSEGERLDRGRSTGLVDPEERAGLEAAARGARANETPFVSFFAPEEILTLARGAGFRQVRHVPAAELEARYFDGRPDGLRPSSGEALLVATT